MIGSEARTRDARIATMRKISVAVVISSALFGAVAAQAESGMTGGADLDGDGYLSQAELAQFAPTLSASFNAMDTDDDRKLSRDEFNAWHDLLKASMDADLDANPSAKPDSDTTTGSNVSVGAARSNADKRSSSGTYHPYAAGTVGDDPAKPTSTSAPPDAKDGAKDQDSGPTDQWTDDGADTDGDGYLSKAELTKVAPTLSASFGAMDVNNDQKLTRSEFRSWHESLKARMVADDTGK